MTWFRVGDAPLIRYLASERAAVDYCNEVVDGAGRLLQVDRVTSMRALVEVEDDFAYDVKMLGPFQTELLQEVP